MKGTEKHQGDCASLGVLFFLIYPILQRNGVDFEEKNLNNFFNLWKLIFLISFLKI